MGLPKSAKPSPKTAPPPQPVTSINIKCFRDKSGAWIVECPEWKCRVKSKNATATVASIVAEIETHNDEIERGIVPYWKDWNAFARQEGLAPLRREAWPPPPHRHYGVREAC